MIKLTVRDPTGALRTTYHAETDREFAGLGVRSSLFFTRFEPLSVMLDPDLVPDPTAGQPLSRPDFDRFIAQLRALRHA